MTVSPPVSPSRISMCVSSVMPVVTSRISALPSTTTNTTRRTSSPSGMSVSGTSSPRASARRRRSRSTSLKSRAVTAWMGTTTASGTERV